MNRFTGVVLYVLIWWTLLFAVLPVGVRSRAEPDPASGVRGTPDRPMLMRKIIATTLISAVVWFAFYLVIRDQGLLSFRHGWLALPPPPGASGEN